MKRKRNIPKIGEIKWGERAARITPPGVLSIALAVLTVFIGIGILENLIERSRVLRMADTYLEAWRDQDYEQIRDLYGNPGSIGVRSRYRVFMPSMESAAFRVPESSRTKPDNGNFPIVFIPLDWKGKHSPWVIDLSRIDTFKLEQVRLWRRYSQGAVAAEVEFQSNQGPVKRRVVLFFLTESSRCPITAIQILPPDRPSMVGF